MKLPDATSELVKLTAAAPGCPAVVGTNSSVIVTPVTPFPSVTFPLIVTALFVAVGPLSVPLLTFVIAGAAWSIQNDLVAVTSCPSISFA